MDDQNEFADSSPIKPYLVEGPEGDTVVVLERILPYLLNRTTFQLNQLLKADLKPYDLSISNWRVLAVVATNDAVTMNKIAMYAMIEQPTASRMVDRLEADGLILRRDAETDRRFRSLALTDAGRKAYEAVRDLAFAHTTRALDGLSDEERDAFTKTLMRIEANLAKPLPAE
ncbi:MAG: MarR family transcriptional regulator [Pseudomonadota bacterium]|nr:MarR family transcriptional regulator [Pseudomonadota bacterium]